MKEQFKTAIDMIFEKDVSGGQKLIRETIQNDARYKFYKKTLKEYGLDFQTVTVDEKIYEDLESIITGYDKGAKLAIIDELYKKIASNK